MQVLREGAVRLLVGLGFATAGTWNDQRLLQKLKEVVMLVEIDDTMLKEYDGSSGSRYLLQCLIDTQEDVELVNSLDDVWEEVDVASDQEEVVSDFIDDEEIEMGIDNEDEFDDEEDDFIDDDEDDELDEYLGEGAEIEDDVEEVEVEVEVIEDETAEVVEPPSLIETTVIPRQKAKRRKSFERVSGIKILKTRPFCAGVVIRRRGLTAGITSEMVNEVDVMMDRKKKNPTTSKTCLSAAWHAIRGFMQNEIKEEK